MITTHALEFEARPWEPSLSIRGQRDYAEFRVGTCEGLWSTIDDAYQILVITNHAPGNGHLTDVFEWFENSCKRDGKHLRILEVWNQGFRKHLIEKRGFKPDGGDNLIKKLKAMKK